AWYRRLRRRILGQWLLFHHPKLPVLCSPPDRTVGTPPVWPPTAPMQGRYELQRQRRFVQISPLLTFLFPRIYLPKTHDENIPYSGAKREQFSSFIANVSVYPSMSYKASSDLGLQGRTVQAIVSQG